MIGVWIMIENQIARGIVDTAYGVRKRLGPGLLESVYETVLAHALQKKGMSVLRQVPVSFRHHGLTFDEGFREDLVIMTLALQS